MVPITGLPRVLPTTTKAVRIGTRTDCKIIRVYINVCYTPKRLSAIFLYAFHKRARLQRKRCASRENVIIFCLLTVVSVKRKYHVVAVYRGNTNYYDSYTVWVNYRVFYAFEINEFANRRKKTEKKKNSFSRNTQ